jgi:hypothetical protein
MNYSWVALVQPATITAPVHCTTYCTNDADCTPGERCVGGTCRLD